MLRIYLSQNETNEHVGTVGNYYARVDNNPPIDIDELAELIKEHNIGFSKGSIVGILKDMVTIVRRQVLNGQPVKIDNLAIFKASIENKGGWPTLKDVNLHVGGENDNIRDIHLLAQATGDFTRSELSKEVKLVLDRQSQQMVANAGGNPDGSGTTTDTGDDDQPSGGGTQTGGGTQQGSGTSGSGTQGTGTQTGGGTQQNQNNGGTQQNADGMYWLTIAYSGNGTMSLADENGNASLVSGNRKAGKTFTVSVVPVEGQTPTATLSGTEIPLVEDEGHYVGSFVMPEHNALLEVFTGSNGNSGGAGFESEGD